MQTRWHLCIIMISITLVVSSAVYGKERRGRRKDSRASVSTTTFLDTLNRGKELHLRKNDIVSVAQPGQDVIPGGKKMVPNGYRIQLMASSSEETVTAQKKRIEQSLGVAVYITYDQPYYKVYAGDYTTRRDAEKALEKIKQSGYPDAWIVKSKVFVDN